MRRKLLIGSAVLGLGFSAMLVFFIVMVSAVTGQASIVLSNAPGLSNTATNCAVSTTGGTTTSIKSPQSTMAAGGPAVAPMPLGAPIHAALLAGKTVWVGASDYGPNPGQPPIGGSGVFLRGTTSFAELSTNPSAPLSQLDFSALGNLPYGTTLVISYGSKTVVAEKLDVGAGGGNVTLGGAAAGNASGSYPRGIDLWRHTAKQLGFSGIGVVAIKLVALGQGTGPGVVLTSATGTGATCTAPPVSGPLASKIITIAQSQVGYHDHGNYCSKYGPCDEWCALFATWVWGHAGVPIPSYPFTGSIYDWGQAHNLLVPASSFPAPGDIVLYGTGPSSTSTSLHTGVVVATNSKTHMIETVEGDYNHAVVFLPWHKPAATSPDGKIYSYVEP